MLTLIKIFWKGRKSLENKKIVVRRRLFSKTNNKAFLAAVVFHIVYSFVFGMLIGGKNKFIFLYEKDWKTAYLIITPLIHSLPYLLSGYLITLGRNSYQHLKLKNLNLFMMTLTPMLIIYLLSFLGQYVFPFRDMYGLFIFINYPAAAHLSIMDLVEYNQNLLVLFSVIFPHLMTLIGGQIRIKILEKGEINE